MTKMPAHQNMMYHPTPHRRREYCSITFLRWALFLFITFFLLTGCVLVSLGVYTLTQNISLVPLVPYFYSISVFCMTSIGGVVLLSSILGCHGTIQERRCSLILFSILLMLVMLAEIAVGILALIVYTTTTAQGFSMDLSEKFITEWGVDESLTKAIDDIQIKYKCCGSNYYTDWQKSDVVTAMMAATPDSCCKTPIMGCGKVDHPSNLFEKGCAVHIEEKIRLTVYLIPALSLGFSMLQIFGVIFSCALAQQVKRSRRSYKEKYSFS